jgi:hypothetical protein
MRNILALVGLAVVLVVGLGWYLGWYHVKTEPAGPGHTHVTVDVDRDKIIKDEKAAVKKVEEILHPKGIAPKPKEVGGTQTGFAPNSEGGVELPSLPPLPKVTLPPPPSYDPAAPINPDGTPKLVLPPRPNL